MANSKRDAHLEIDEEDVRRTAYFLWEQDGRPEGRAQEYWHRAWAQHRRMRGYDDELREGPEGDPSDGDS